MDRNEIIHTTNHFLIEEFETDAARIHPGADLKEVLDLDSLDYVDLVVIIQSNFGVKLEGKDFAAMTTFRDLYDAIEQKLNVTA